MVKDKGFKMKKVNKKIFLLFFIFLVCFNSIFAINNEEAISVNRQYKQTLDLNKYGGQDFANKHIKNSSPTEQANLLKNREEIRKRINAVSDLISESKQYNMKYTWGGNHIAKANTREAIQGGMDCSGWCSQYLYMMGININNFSTNTASGYNEYFKGVVATAKRKGYTIRMDTQYHDENGWIYTFAWKAGGDIKHIGMSLGNKLSHARGGPDPAKQKTIDITGRPNRYAPPSYSFSVEDLIYFIANEPQTARSMGLSLANMVDPDKVRSDWANVTKGTPGGELKEGFSVGDGELSDSDLDLAYELFHIEFNFDEWFAKPIFQTIGKVVDYIVPIAVAFASLFIIIRILYEILQAIAKGDYSFRTLFFISLEKMFSACIVLILLGLYKDIVYKPLIDFVSGGFVKVAFGRQMEIMSQSHNVPEGNLNSIYYLALQPLEMFCNYWITSYQELTHNFGDIYDMATNFGGFIEGIFKSLLMLFCCAVSVWLGIKFVLSIFLMQVMITITLAFAVINLALTTIPRMSASGNTIINAVISTIMKIIPVYLVMFVWIDFSNIILNADIPVAVQMLFYMALFLMTGFVFQLIKHLIKYIFITINFLVELMKQAG